jgi:Fe-S cluster assembly iron-binding protein IscA
LRIAGGEVRPRFVTEAQEGDEVVEQDGIRVFVAKAILDELGEVVIDVTREHEQLTVWPLESDT